MKTLLILAFSVSFYLSAFSQSQQQYTFENWQQESRDDIRMLPEYGNMPKTSGQLEADKTLIATEIKTNGDREKASAALVKLGFDYMYRGDLKTAMYRFNQAWLLNPKNENDYWGFGSIYYMLGNESAALKQFEKGLAINPNSSNIITDQATIFMTRYAKGHQKENLDAAISLFKKSYGIDPTNQNTLFKLSAVYFYMNDCANALLYYNKCIQLGGKPVTKEYTEALKEHCKN